MSKTLLSIGLTGGIGSGKTLICRAFEALGVPVFFADMEAKKCYDDMDFVHQVAKVISPKIIVEGRFVKEELAKIIFNDMEKRKQLNKIIHPLVIANYEKWLENQTYPYAIMESAIIFEIGWQQYFDKVISIFSPLKVAVERVMQRDNISEKEVEKRMSTQLPNEKKAMLADYVIKHDNNIMVVPQILEIHQKILNLSTQKEKTEENRIKI